MKYVPTPHHVIPDAKQLQTVITRIIAKGYVFDKNSQKKHCMEVNARYVTLAAGLVSCNARYVTLAAGLVLFRQDCCFGTLAVTVKFVILSTTAR